MKTKIFYCLITLLLVTNINAVNPQKADDIKLLIVDGLSGHDWRRTTQSIISILIEESAYSQKTNVTSLFNGKDLTGWGYSNKTQQGVTFESFDGKIESKEKRFFAKDGIITANPYIESYTERYQNLWTAKEFPKDFVLTLEFRASKNADSGIFLRGIQLQCRDYLLAGPYKDLQKYKAQDWNKIEVVVKDNIAHCTCNGEIIEEALKLPATGPIGLESDRGQMEYRNILVKEMQ